MNSPRRSGDPVTRWEGDRVTAGPIHHAVTRSPGHRVIPGGRPGSDAYRSARSVLAELGDDVHYLELKESLGEALTASERARLDAARREGGGSS